VDSSHFEEVQRIKYYRLEEEEEEEEVGVM
jgi:hypothetical protein